MTEYEYEIYFPGQAENHVRVRTAEPIPGLIKGHCLAYEDAEGRLSMKQGHRLEIVNVEVYVFAQQETLERHVTHVYTRWRDRAALLKDFES
jgi:hypothetical protein